MKTPDSSTPRLADLPSSRALVEVPPAALLAELHAALAHEPASVSLRVRWRVIALAWPITVALTLLARFALTGREPLRADLGELLRPEFALQLCAVLALALGGTFLTLRRGRFGLGSPQSSLLACALLSSPVYLLLTASKPTALPATARAASGLHPAGVPCFVVASVVALGSLLALAFALRRSTPSAVHARGAALGAVAGLWSGALLVVHCPAYTLMHLLLGHTLPVVLFVALGAAIAPLFLRTR